MSRPNAQELIDELGLAPMGSENVSWTQVYVASDEAAQGVPWWTSIIGLLVDSDDSFSDIHMLDKDELWIFHLGDPFDLLLLHADGSDEVITLGPDPRVGHRLQAVAPRGSWMGARLSPGGEYAVYGNTLAPGWTPDDLVVFSAAGPLAERWPNRADLIRRLTKR